MCGHSVEETIRQKLLRIEEQEQVRILHAAESGSRAWGIASPDSDYDVRFIYVRKKEDYLRLDPVKDVIEWQLDPVLDINGWDLKKALVQFHKSNSTLFEWCASPIIYKTTRQWEEIRRTARPYFSVKACAYHYYGTANSTWCQHLQGETVKYKKYFYALRPLLACRYIEEHRCPPPVGFEELMKTESEPELKDEMVRLWEKKMVSAEYEEHPRIPAVSRFIEGELKRQKELIGAMADDRREDWGELNRIFLQILKSEEEE